MRIESDEGGVQFVPVTLIERLVVTARVEIESSLFGAIAAEGGSVLILSPRDHRRMALLLPPGGGDHGLRLQQYSAVSDEKMVLACARTLIRMKLHGQYRALAMMRGNGPLWRQAWHAFPALIANVKAAPSIESIRGFEGGAASLYFQAMAESVPASWEFVGRKRRPPPDPLNALLSLSYTLLHYEAVRALHISGLDPFLGFLHAPEYSRESLACDCIEPLRPTVDRFILALMQQRVIRTDHFGIQQGSCLLGKAGRGIFYANWEPFAALQRKRLRAGIQWLKKGIRR